MENETGYTFGTDIRKMLISSWSKLFFFLRLFPFGLLLSNLQSHNVLLMLSFAVLTAGATCRRCPPPNSKYECRHFSTEDHWNSKYVFKFFNISNVLVKHILRIEHMENIFEFFKYKEQIWSNYNLDLLCIHT